MKNTFPFLGNLVIVILMLTPNPALCTEKCDVCDDVDENGNLIHQDCEECCEGRCCQQRCLPPICNPCDYILPDENGYKEECHIWKRDERTTHYVTDVEYFKDDTHIKELHFGCHNIYTGEVLYMRSYTEYKVNLVYNVEDDADPVHIYSKCGEHGYLRKALLPPRINSHYYHQPVSEQIGKLGSFIMSFPKAKKEIINFLINSLFQELNATKDSKVKNNEYVFNSRETLNHFNFKPNACEKVHATAKPVWQSATDVYMKVFTAKIKKSFYCDGQSYHVDYSPKKSEYPDYEKSEIVFNDNHDLVNYHYHVGFTKLQYCFEYCCP